MGTSIITKLTDYELLGFCHGFPLTLIIAATPHIVTNLMSEKELSYALKVCITVPFIFVYFYVIESYTVEVQTVMGHILWSRQWNDPDLPHMPARTYKTLSSLQPEIYRLPPSAQKAAYSSRLFMTVDDRNVEELISTLRCGFQVVLNTIVPDTLDQE